MFKKFWRWYYSWGRLIAILALILALHLMGKEYTRLVKEHSEIYSSHPTCGG